MKIADQLRAEAVADYLRGDMTQEQVCAAFEVRTGRRLSPRTLRSWLASAGSRPGLPPRRDRLLRALRQVQVLQAEIEAVIAELDEPGTPGVAEDLPPSRSEILPPVADPAARPPVPNKLTTTPAAASVPAAERVTSTAATTSPQSFWD